MEEVSKPVAGSRVRVPSEPAGGAALATPLMRKPPPAATATARPPARSRRGNPIAGMIELTIDCLGKKREHQGVRMVVLPQLRCWAKPNLLMVVISAQTLEPDPTNT